MRMGRVNGRLPFREWQTWFEVVGDGEEQGRLPLLVLHGGPGSAHDWLVAPNPTGWAFA